MPDDVELASAEAPPRDSRANAWPQHPDDGIPGPGGLVFITCLLVDFMVFPIGAALGTSLSPVLHGIDADRFLFPALWGIGGAQLAMLCIWLGIMATALYWSLVGVVVFTIVVLFLNPLDIHWPSVFEFLTVVFVHTLPFALVPVAGFRLAQRPKSEGDAATSESARFPLSRLFLWTAIAAGVLGLQHWIPAPFLLGMGTVFVLFAFSLTALATVWAVLRPGPIWRPLALAPFGVLATAVLFSAKMNGWRLEFTAIEIYTGIVFILSLAGLLAIYRRAGKRLVFHDKGALLVPHHAREQSSP